MTFRDAQQSPHNNFVFDDLIYTLITMNIYLIGAQLTENWTWLRSDPAKLIDSRGYRGWVEWRILPSFPRVYA